MRLLAARLAQAAAAGSRRHLAAAAVLPNKAQLRGYLIVPQQRPAASASCRRGRQMMALTEDAVQALRNACDAAGQAHLLEHWETLSAEQQQQLAEEIRGVDFAFIQRALQASLAAASTSSSSGHAPVTDVVSLQGADSAQRESWRRLGLQLIAQGKVGVLLLAGGQGTRLGSDLPKGCYDIGLPSHKSLFQLQAERLLAVQRLAAAAAAPDGDAGEGAAGGAPATLHWFIMTSPFTHQDTLDHFEAHAFFGLAREQVTFFQQGFLPCVTEQGRLILETPSTLAKAPDGNGGLYRALVDSGVLTKMQQLGIQGLDVYCVDNALARVADPEFLGCCFAAGAQLGLRVVAKAGLEERVGVLAHDAAGSLQVLEYSELDPATAAARDAASGALLYNWANICMHFFSTAWLGAAAAALGASGEYHVARKAIPEAGGDKVAGIKLEAFIFDPFHTAAAVALYEVDRADHFAPVKNAPGSAAGDSPDTARAAVLAQGARWVAAAGGALAPGVTGVEVAPLSSYGGEGLAARLAGGTVVGVPGESAAQL